MKDPAFLFYSSDWLTGCQFMSMEERGQYITLLAAQHQNGHLDPKRVGFILGYGWDMVSDMVKSKFELDANGMIFNERLDAEIEKRAQYTEKQRNNGIKGGRPAKNKNPNETQTITQLQTQTKPKNNPTENENINDNIIDLEKGVQGEKQLTTEQMERIPEKVNEFADRALQDYGLLQSAQNTNKHITEKGFIEIVTLFRERQIHSTDYYHVYQQFKRHLLSSPILKTWEPKKGKTKFDQALTQDFKSKIEYDEHGNITYAPPAY
jgi:uncharacterized protein YdaU (DUF1376 family)